MTKYNVYLGLEGITWAIVPKFREANWRGEVGSWRQVWFNLSNDTYVDANIYQNMTKLEKLASRHPKKSWRTMVGQFLNHIRSGGSSFWRDTEKMGTML